MSTSQDESCSHSKAEEGVSKEKSTSTRARLPNRRTDADPSTVFSLDDFPPMSFFEETTTYPALIVPVKRTAELRKTLSKVLLRRPKTKNVYQADDDDDKDHRILVLASEEIAQKDPTVATLLSQDCRKTTYTLKTSYQDYTADEVLKKILPTDDNDNNNFEIPSSFEQVGRIAHVNLREQVLPYKYWIGKVLLDKNQPTIRTVVNKLGTIENEYRTFGMEVIAGYDGQGWSQVTVKEERCTFDLDFQQVYWNSRLAGEHRRLVQLIRNEARQQQQRQRQQQLNEHDDRITIVADLMAGVGPFAVPLTAAGTGGSRDDQPLIHVYANDLNPSSYKYLQINARQNKCKNLHCYNMDAREFVFKLQQEKIPIDHVIMNLPKTAPEFLDAFRGYQQQQGKQQQQQHNNLPRIHVHCFAPKATASSEQQQECNSHQDAIIIIERCAAALGCPLEGQRDQVDVRVVRNVAPNKNMLCVSFRLPPQVQTLPRVIVTTSNTNQAPASDKAAAKYDNDDDDDNNNNNNDDSNKKRQKIE